MANTYTQLLIQFVFAVKLRQQLLPNDRKEEVHRYMTGIVQQRGHKILQVHCMPDHAHVLVGLHPGQAMSDLVRDVKSASSKWINEQSWMPGRFGWQDGYGAFSYSRSQLSVGANYVQHQEQHHRKKTFREEYFDFLDKFQVEHDQKYVFDFMD